MGCTTLYNQQYVCNYVCRIEVYEYSNYVYDLIMYGYTVLYEIC